MTLTFRATGLGVGVSTGEPGACLTLRLDLEISSHKARMGRSWEDWNLLFFFIGTQPHTVVGTTGVFEHKKNLSRGFFRDDVWD